MISLESGSSFFGFNHLRNDLLHCFLEFLGYGVLHDVNILLSELDDIYSI